MPSLFILTYANVLIFVWLFDWFHDDLFSQKKKEIGFMIWEGGHGKRDESHFLFLTAVTLAASPTDFAASVRLIEFRWFFRSKREGGWEFITNFVLDSSLV